MSMRYMLLALSVGCVTTALPTEPPTTAEVVDYVEAVNAAACEWCLEALPSLPIAKPRLHGVWAVSAGDVFAVGEHGTILRRVGGVWTAMVSGTTNDLQGVWAASSSDVWAVGLAGTVLHFNGTAWSPVPITPSSSSDVEAVWGSSASDVWLVGSDAVTHWDGQVLVLSKNFSPFLQSVSGTGPRDVWVTGENTYLHHFTGTWQPTIKPLPGTSTMHAVLAIGANDVWVTDAVSGKETLHWTGGTTWTPHGTGVVGGVNRGMFSSLSARASNDIWGTGTGGSVVGHWNGSAWTSTQPLGLDAHLWSVTTTAGHAWIVGGDGLIAHRLL